MGRLKQRGFVWLFAVVLGWSGLVWAEGRGPADRVTELMVKLKAFRSPVVIIEFVDWESAFAGASEADRAKYGARTPLEMRRYYEQVLGDPEAYARREISRQLALVPADKRPIVEAQISEAVAQVRQNQDRYREFYRDFTFEVGAAEVTGDRAVVPLTTAFGGETFQERIPLIRRDKVWYLPSVDIVSGGGARETTVDRASERGESPPANRGAP